MCTTGMFLGRPGAGGRGQAREYARQGGLRAWPAEKRTAGRVLGADEHDMRSLAYKNVLGAKGYPRAPRYVIIVNSWETKGWGHT